MAERLLSERERLIRELIEELEDGEEAPLAEGVISEQLTITLAEELR